ncbi:PIN domain-containing protein [Pseudomonas fluorescens]|uniref:PIN domain-containing protein n=1 Tax=Pseudomonas fluorescens TaxID=294 RepID=UPI00192AC1ED|nr:PIN domain-containing protein [Pseudomonas fluorescens]MBL4981456.1 hypothetical protein [Pseudomonas fluorescens]
MDDSIKTLYVVPDTNVFVQCRQLGTLDWRELGDYEKIVLVVTRPVIAEVDRQKGASGRLAKRARLANGLFTGFLTNDEVVIDTQGSGPAVVLTLGQNLEPSGELVDVLNYSHADDLLVGIVHAYQRANDHQVLFLSFDTGPLLSAKSVGVPYKSVPPTWLLNSENDEEQKRIKELEGQLKRLQAAEPQCTIFFPDTPWEIVRQKRLPLTDTQIAELLRLLKTRHPLQTDFGSKVAAQREGRSSPFGLPSVERFVPVTEQEINEYQVRYTQWIEGCTDFFRKAHEKLNGQEEVHIVSTVLANIGSRPAANVLVAFQITGNHLALMAPPYEDEEEIKTEPLSLTLAPWAPQGRWKSEYPNRDAQTFAALTRTHDIPLFASSFRDNFVPDPHTFYWKNGRPEAPALRVELECSQWRHKEEEKSYDVRIVYTPEFQRLEGALQVTISATNLAEPLRKIQNIKVIIKEVDAFDEVKTLIF